MGTVEEQLSQFAHVRACCQAMVAGTQLLLWREDGFHLRSVRLRSVPPTPEWGGSLFVDADSVLCHVPAPTCCTCSGRMLRSRQTVALRDVAAYASLTSLTWYLLRFQLAYKHARR
jgi:hypothetical protein